MSLTSLMSESPCRPPLLVSARAISARMIRDAQNVAMMMTTTLSSADTVTAVSPMWQQHGLEDVPRRSQELRH